VQFAAGSEQFKPLFATDYEHPEPGEVIFADDASLVVARRWCWRQSDESATRQDTVDAIFTTEAHHPNGQEYIQTAIDDLLGLLETHVGGMFKTGMADSQNPGVSE
jgi:DNA/RNA-binding domain of Phe-tRNA-synthetase-like protein